MMMTPPPILNIEIIFFDLCIFCLKSEALILDFHQGFQNKKGTFLPPPANTAKALPARCMVSWAL